METIDRPIPLHLSVQNAIKNYIIEKGLKAGETLLPETELATSLGVSRNSVREAVKALESMGILETRRGIGVFVRSFSFDPILEYLPFARTQDLKELTDLLEIRQILETGMMTKVVSTMTEARLTELNAILQRMRSKADRSEPFREEDREFHQTLLQATGNDMALKLLDMFWLLFSNTSQYAHLEDQYPQQTYKDHVAIVEAVAKRNADEARAALLTHYAGISRRLELAKRETGESSE
jgi:DNA-binding FadR family transcriptional regulator